VTRPKQTFSFKAGVSASVKGYTMPAPTAMHGLRAVFHGAGVV
jgi:hypothetical protein